MIDVWHIKYIAKNSLSNTAESKEWDANIIANTKDEAVLKLKAELKPFDIDVIGEPDHSTMTEHEYENN